jgi:hypothetical protein
VIIADVPAGNTDRRPWPEPQAYAHMQLPERGAVCASMSVFELHEFAAIYTAYLQQLAGGFPVSAAWVFGQMCACAWAWRDHALTVVSVGNVA